MRGRVGALVARHRALAVTGAVAVAGGLVFVLVWFQPQKLFIEKTVRESAPSAQPAPATDSPTRGPFTVAAGDFRSLDHETTGRARILRLSDGSFVLRFEDLDTSNGPDLRVYLSRLPADRSQREYGEDFLDLGGLKGNRGDQNYAIPAGTDVSGFYSAVIWCRRFTVGFGVAPLTSAT